jgi:hypothetical protein
MIHTETVHASQLKRAMASYAAQGYPPRYGPHPDGDGMMVVVIVVPDDGAVPDWQIAPPPRRRWPRFDWRAAVKWLCVIAIVVGIGYFAYSMFAAPQQATQPSQPAQAAPEPSLWERITGTPTNGEPVVEPAIELPWDAAGRQVGETLAGIGRLLLAAFAAAVVAGCAFVADKVRRDFRK